MSVKLVLEKSGDGYDILRSKMLSKNRFPNQSRQVCQDTEKNVAGKGRSVIIGWQAVRPRVSG